MCSHPLSLALSPMPTRDTFRTLARAHLGRRVAAQAERTPHDLRVAADEVLNRVAAKSEDERGPRRPRCLDGCLWPRAALLRAVRARVKPVQVGADALRVDFVDLKRFKIRSDRHDQMICELTLSAQARSTCFSRVSSISSQLEQPAHTP